jgi:pimeloyl-ACP methyl ester carboxylesterase
VNPRARLRAALAGAGALLAVFLLTSGPGSRQAAPHRALRVSAGGLELRAVRAGRGPSLVLLHGYGESLIAWRGSFDRLASRTDVTAFDLPGSGVSDKPRNGYGTEQLATAVLAATARLGLDSFVLVGHSLGGAIAVAVALLAPERVRALVLIAPAGAAAPTLLPDSTGAVSATTRALIAEYEAQRTRFSSVHDPAWLEEADRDAAYLPADDPAYRAALAAILREFDFGYLTASRVRGIHRPVLLLWGEFDQVIPVTQGESLASRFPSARLVVLIRTWHRPHVERPAETADTILAFVAALGMASSH